MRRTRPASTAQLADSEFEAFTLNEGQRLKRVLIAHFGVDVRSEVAADAPLPEPGLDAALAKLSPRQRVAVLLVHGLGWTYAETAQAMGVPITSIRNHVHRGVKRLRRLLGEE